MDFNFNSPSSPADLSQPWALRPAVKKKRVSRACDECRKKKVKCDAKSPCTRCSVYSLHCTYDKPGPPRKHYDSQRPETKLRQADKVLQLLLPPGTDIYAPGFDLSTLSARVAAKLGIQEPNDTSEPPSSQSSCTRGSSSHSQSNSLGAPCTPGLSSRSYSHSHTPADSPSSVELNSDVKVILPPKHVALRLISVCWMDACVLFRFVHRPFLIRQIHMLYEMDPEDYTEEHFRCLPLVYSVLSVGALFLGPDDAGPVDLGFGHTSVDRVAYDYFVAARDLINLVDPQDLTSVQTIVMLVIFLQCSARLSTCYSYIGIAMRAALRMGLHRNLPSTTFNPAEIEIRKRLFWTIRKMDIYINSVLGLPICLRDQDFDQEMPREIDDEFITTSQYLPQDQSVVTSPAIANAHTRVMTVLADAVNTLYPVGGSSKELPGSTGPTQPTGPFTYTAIHSIECDLANWLESLPAALQPSSPNPSPQYFKASRLLGLTHCYVQLILYRPFIHYLGRRHMAEMERDPAKRDDAAMLYANNCLRVSSTTMHLAHQLVEQNMLNGAYWFSLYTIFFAISCLVFYCHENARSQDPAIQANVCAYRADADLGKQVVEKLKSTSDAASRIYDLLDSMFEQLNLQAASVDRDSAAASAAVPYTTPSPPPSTLLARFHNLRVNSPLSSNQFSFDSTDMRQSPAYVPGVLDQLDSQLFGKFLPPYMMEQPSTTTTTTTTDDPLWTDESLLHADFFNHNNSNNYPDISGMSMNYN